MITATRVLIILALCLFASISPSKSQDQSHLPTSAPITTNSVGNGGSDAAQTVVRLICQITRSQGTGFLHKSGKVITASHVVRGCPNPVIIGLNGLQIQSTVVATNEDTDLALVNPATPLPGSAIKISDGSALSVGSEVSTWGFPGGYYGVAPLLGVGYLSGVDRIRLPSGKVITQWVVNAAFNHGNSGGPLIDIESGSVIGVVDSKLAPISDDAIAAINVLRHNPSGMQYTAKTQDGSVVNFSEAQVVATVLDELRSQVQLVIGEAVLLKDLRDFLTDQKIDP